VQSPGESVPLAWLGEGGELGGLEGTEDIEGIGGIEGIVESRGENVPLA
jgi:hypothetical protein